MVSKPRACRKWKVRPNSAADAVELELERSRSESRESNDMA